MSHIQSKSINAGQLNLSLPVASYPRQELKSFSMSGDTIDLNNFREGEFAAIIKFVVNWNRTGENLGNVKFSLSVAGRTPSTPSPLLINPIKFREGLTEYAIALIPASDLQKFSGRTVYVGAVNSNTAGNTTIYIRGQLNGSPTPAPAPTPTPTPTPRLYEWRIITGYNPEVPVWVVNKLRGYMKKNGWGLNNIARINNGYMIQMEEIGSATFFVVAALIAGLLALIYVSVKSYEVIRLSDNAKEVAKPTFDVNDTINKIKNSNLADSEKAELIEKALEVYEVDITPTPGGGGGGGGGLTGGLGIAVLVLVLIAAGST